MKLKLLIEHTGQSFTLKPEIKYIVGSASDCTINLPNIDGIAERHIALSFIDNTWQVEDLNSANGTFVNGQTISIYIINAPVQIALAGNFLITAAPFVPEITPITNNSIQSIQPPIYQPSVLPPPVYGGVNTSDTYSPQPPITATDPSNQFSGVSNSQSSSISTKFQLLLGDTWQSLKYVCADPYGGITEFIKSVGEDRASLVGLLLSVLVAFSNWGALLKAMSLIKNGFAYRGVTENINIPFEVNAKILILNLLSIAGLVFLLWAIKSIYNKSQSIKSLIFAASIPYLPAGLTTLIFWITGYTSVEFLVILFITTLTTVILFLNSILSNLLRLSTRNVFLLIPIILICNSLINRIIYSIIFPLGSFNDIFG